jgi:SAM-dependent methyltransferase
VKFDEDALQTVRETRLLIDEYDSWILEEIGPHLGRRLIEIGCGLGNMLRHFTDLDLVVGIEPSQETVTAVREQFSTSANVAVYEYDITDPAVLALQRFSFDTAVSLNVFEHIEDDRRAIANTGLLLKPGGVFVLIVPAHPSLYGTMDRSIGHYRRYTKDSARKKLEDAGFTILRQKYLNTLGALGWLVNGRLLRRVVPPTGQLRLFNRIVPILKTAERAFPPPFGISLMTVAQRGP